MSAARRSAAPAPATYTVRVRRTIILEREITIEAGTVADARRAALAAAEDLGDIDADTQAGAWRVTQARAAR